MKRLALFLAILTLMAAAVWAASDGLAVSRAYWKCTGSHSQGYQYYSLSGTLTNTGKTTYDWVVLEYGVYDSRGRKVKDLTAYTKTVAPGDSVAFTSDEDIVASYDRRTRSIPYTFRLNDIKAKPRTR